MKTPDSSLSLLAKTVAASVALALGAGCAAVTQVGTSIGQATGIVSAEQSESINRSAQAIEKTFQDITPEQEYYIGRSVAATVLNTYKPFDQQQANNYLNLLGQTIAQFSNKPETFGGYHMLLMDSDEINAFAAPGGLVMISRGMVRCCKTEDEL
ncbi:MAG TPA: M48 family metalloprotease, partial [Verrucomicrobiota bacterium]|nr:M48 family metalloprotease [Verrucomicrobiota bacterium]